MTQSFSTSKFSLYDYLQVLEYENLCYQYEEYKKKNKEISSRIYPFYHEQLYLQQVSQRESYSRQKQQQQQQFLLSPQYPIQQHYERYQKESLYPTQQEEIQLPSQQNEQDRKNYHFRKKPHDQQYSQYQHEQKYVQQQESNQQQQNEYENGHLYEVQLQLEQQQNQHEQNNREERKYQKEQSHVQRRNQYEQEKQQNQEQPECPLQYRKCSNLQENIDQEQRQYSLQQQQQQHENPEEKTYMQEQRHMEQKRYLHDLEYSEGDQNQEQQKYQQQLQRREQNHYQQAKYQKQQQEHQEQHYMQNRQQYQQNDIKIPLELLLFYWNPMLCPYEIRLGCNLLTFDYIGECNHKYDIGTLRSNHPIIYPLYLMAYVSSSSMNKNVGLNGYPFTNINACENKNANVCPTLRGNGNARSNTNGYYSRRDNKNIEEIVPSLSSNLRHKSMYSNGYPNTNVSTNVNANEDANSIVNANGYDMKETKNDKETIKEVEENNHNIKEHKEKWGNQTTLFCNENGNCFNKQIKMSNNANRMNRKYMKTAKNESEVYSDCEWQWQKYFFYYEIECRYQNKIPLNKLHQQLYNKIKPKSVSKSKLKELSMEYLHYDGERTFMNKTIENRNKMYDCNGRTDKDIEEDGVLYSMMDRNNNMNEKENIENDMVDDDNNTASEEPEIQSSHTHSDVPSMNGNEGSSENLSSSSSSSHDGSMNNNQYFGERHYMDISVGFSLQDYYKDKPSHHHIGSTPYSLGYSSKSGNIMLNGKVRNLKKENKHDPTFGLFEEDEEEGTATALHYNIRNGPVKSYDGDIIGCGISYITNEFFFTKNGKIIDIISFQETECFLPYIYRNEMNNLQDLNGKNSKVDYYFYPAVGIHGKKEQVHTNFGYKQTMISPFGCTCQYIRKSPFMFKLFDLYVEQMKVFKSKKPFDLTLRMKEEETCYSLVKEYLKNHGYERTLIELKKSEGDNIKKDQVTSLHPENKNSFLLSEKSTRILEQLNTNSLLLSEIRSLILNYKTERLINQNYFPELEYLRSVIESGQRSFQSIYSQWNKSIYLYAKLKILCFFDYFIKEVDELVKLPLLNDRQTNHANGYSQHLKNQRSKRRYRHMNNDNDLSASEVKFFSRVNEKLQSLLSFIVPFVLCGPKDDPNELEIKIMDKWEQKILRSDISMGEWEHEKRPEKMGVWYRTKIEEEIMLASSLLLMKPKHILLSSRCIKSTQGVRLANHSKVWNIYYYITSVEHREETLDLLYELISQREIMKNELINLSKLDYCIKIPLMERKHISILDRFEISSNHIKRISKLEGLISRVFDLRKSTSSIHGKEIIWRDRKQKKKGRDNRRRNVRSNSNEVRESEPNDASNRDSTSSTSSHGIYIGRLLNRVLSSHQRDANESPASPPRHSSSRESRPMHILRNILSVPFGHYNETTGGREHTGRVNESDDNREDQVQQHSDSNSSNGEDEDEENLSSSSHSSDSCIYPTHLPPSPYAYSSPDDYIDDDADSDSDSVRHSSDGHNENEIDTRGLFEEDEENEPEASEVEMSEN